VAADDHVFVGQRPSGAMASDGGCKVCRVLDERGLDGYDDRLLSQWRGESGQRKGYRQLATWLNVTLLRREMDEVGLPTLGDEAASKYERLQGDGASAHEVEVMLEREGIDVAGLRTDFVSYGVVRTHLTQCLDAAYEDDSAGDWEREAIDIARDRAREKVGEAVRSLRNKGRLEGGDDLAVDLDVAIGCEDCDTRLPLGRALRRGRVCDCESATTTGTE
jgi:hypothetical protein